MDFSFIIVNYGTPTLTKACLDSLFLHCPAGNYEIIVIDNGSDDGSADYLESSFGSRLRLIRNADNLGFARANNQGARIACGEYLFFLNSDTLFTANILPTLKNDLTSDSRIGIVAPQLLNSDGSRQAKAYGPFPTIGYLLHKHLLSRHDNDFPRRADWVSGAALVIRQSVFNLIGGWDENFFLYLEDVDLSWRIRQAGYKVRRNESTSIIHCQGSSLGKNSQKREYYFRSQDYLFTKYYGPGVGLALRIIRSPYRALLSIKQKNHENRH